MPVWNSCGMEAALVYIDNKSKTDVWWLDESYFGLLGKT